MADAALSALLRRPFAEQVAAFRARLGTLLPTARWDDLWQAQHDRAFMVAGAAQADLLADLATAVERAIAGGESIDQFRSRFRDIVRERGWQGWTGQGSAAGEAWRTRVIYTTNLRTSYAAGRMAQLRAGGYSHFIYRHGGSQDPRPQHLAWDGLVLPVDHPFWATHAPPNGWGCSCYLVGARGPATARRLGGDPDKALPEGWDRIDPRTGAPAGIDRGWAYSPGDSVSELVSHLAGKLDQLPAQPSIDLIQSWLAEGVFANWFAKPRGTFPLARLPDADATALGSSARIASLSEETARKQAREHPELTAAEYVLAQRAITAPTAKVQQGRAMVYLREEADPESGGLVLVVKATRTGQGLFVTSVRRLSRAQASRDAELRRLLRREG